MRLDIYLVKAGLSPSRTRALDMIKSGLVCVDGRTVTRAAFSVDDGDCVTVMKSEKEYVSRAAHKLLCAKERFGISFEGLFAIDLGASSGGFCQVMLEDGVREICAVDIGHGQLHESIAKDGRVRIFEGVNARYVSEETFGKRADAVTADLSFISQTLVFEAIGNILKPGGIYIGLIKPQFEAGRERVGKGGIVKDARVHADVIKRVIETANSYGLVCKDIACSPILGGDGNREFLAYYIYEGAPGQIPVCEKIQAVVKGESELR